MQPKENVIDCYDKTAGNYAAQFIDELSKKHLDRILLKTFADENRGRIVDLGCGPGQTTRFFFNCGATEILGADISPQMIAAAKEINPNIDFEVADILDLKFSDESFTAAIAFYAIVHFDYEQLKIAFREIKRILKVGGQFLFSFHVGDEKIHLDEFLESEVNIDFYFFETEKIVEILTETGFETIDVIERQPYKDAEHQSKRAYIWVKKPVEKQ